MERRGVLSLVVAGAGMMLMAAAPSRPGQWTSQGASGSEEHDGEQATDFGAGQRDHFDRPATIGVGIGGDHREQRVSDHRKQRPTPPGGPAADLVLVETGQLLAGLAALRDRPTPTGDPR